MNEQGRANWQKIRRGGKWRYILTFSTGMALTLLLLDAVVGSGYTLLLKQHNWSTYLEQLNWKKLLWQGFFVGAAIAYFYWQRKELAYNDDSDS